MDFDQRSRGMNIEHCTMHNMQSISNDSSLILTALLMHWSTTIGFLRFSSKTFLSASKFDRTINKIDAKQENRFEVQTYLMAHWKI